MKKRIIGSLAIVLIVLLCSVGIVNIVGAISTADAKEPIDTTKPCSLSLTYAVGEKKLEGMEIEIYQAASVSADFQYSLTGAFAEYPIEVNGIKTQSEWQEVKDTLGAYIAADKIAPSAGKKTDVNGIVTFDQLPVGLYFVRWTGNETPDKPSNFAPLLVAVPGLGEDGLWIYDVTALPKPGTLPEPEKQEITLVKLWRDGKHSAERPESVSVDIFKNGELYESIQLTADDNWTYTWETDGSYTWSAVERNVAEGYTVAVQNTDGCTIQITNTLTSDPNPPSDTGDSNDWHFWLILTALAGVVLMVISRRGRAKHEN